MMSWMVSAYEASPVPIKRLLMNVYARYLHFLREGAPMQRAIDLLEHVDRLDPSEIAGYQLDRINEVLTWANDQVDYYRGRVLNGGGAGGTLSHLEELSKVPPLSKGEVRENSAMLTAPNIKKYYGHTSGTTGTPLQLWYDRGQLIWNRAAEKVIRKRAGILPGEPVAVIWGRSVVPRNAHKPPYWVINDVDRELWLSAFHVSRTTAPLYFEAMRRFEAAALETYPSLAYILAKLALETNSRIRFRRVLTSSETLFPFQRQVIEEAFGAEVFDFYGAAERLSFAIECCRHDGLHLLEGFGYVEPTSTSEDVSLLTMTSFTNRAMPLIRYQMTDVTRVIEDPCLCGLKSRRLAPISTKQEDMVITPDGRFVSPSLLTHPFKPLRGVLRSQIIQETLKDLIVRIETGPQYDSGQEAGLLRALAERMGPGVRIEIVKRPLLHLEESGKFRWVISKVHGAHQVVERGQ